MSDIILEIKNLEVHYPIFGGILQRKVGEVRGVDKVDLTISKGDVVGLVGESGSGKTTLGKAIVNILQVAAPTVEVRGEINLFEKDGSKVNLLTLKRKELLKYRKRIQMIFQDPFSSLNPRMIVKDIVKEPMDIHSLL